MLHIKEKEVIDRSSTVSFYAKNVHNAYIVWHVVYELVCYNWDMCLGIPFLHIC